MIPSDVASALLTPHDVRVESEVGGGLSGAAVFRCEGTRTFALRRWPTTTRLDRVLEIQSVIRAVSDRFPLVPRYQSVGGEGRQFHWVDGRNQIWELTEWKPGNPLPYDSARDQIRSGIRAIAAMHLHLRGLRIEDDRIVANVADPARTQIPTISPSLGFPNRGGPNYGRLKFGWRVCPAVVQRIDRLDWLDQNLSRSVATLCPSSMPGDLAQNATDAGQLLIRSWPSTSARLRAQLFDFQHRTVPVHPVVRDIHREHVLFEHGRPSGIIDFDALRVDSPAVDLARWLGSFSIFCQDPAKTIDWCVAGYRKELALQSRGVFQGSGDRYRNTPPQVDRKRPRFLTLVRAIAESSTWISLANWVVWLAENPSRFADFGAVEQRLVHLKAAALAVERHWNCGHDSTDADSI